MCTLLHYHAKLITLLGNRSLLHYHVMLFIIWQLLHYQLMLLHYLAVITVAGVFITLSGSY